MKYLVFALRHYADKIFTTRSFAYRYGFYCTFNHSVEFNFHPTDFR